MNTDTTALQERIARALYEEDKRDAANAGLAFDSDAAWEWARDWTAAVLPIIAAEVRKGQAEALRETADWWAANPDDDVFETDGDTRNWLRDVATEYEAGDQA